MKYILLLILAFSYSIAHAQGDIDSARHDEVRSLVNFYRYMLNTVGSANTPTRDKEVIITESYKKIFSHPEVQVEDDLIADRRVITNKDVSAYLRDVDFFYQNIQFDFKNLNIEIAEKDSGTYFYLVSFESTIEGTDLDGNSYTNSKSRFIEINLNEETNDLKIASVYSTKMSKREELQHWWQSLSQDWVNVFKSYISFDSVTHDVLLKIVALDSLNLSDNQYIIDIAPLEAFKKLRVLNIGRTKVTDLSPLRYAKGLQQLEASHSLIDDISPIPYFSSLSHLDLSYTGVRTLPKFDRLKELKILNLSHTPIENFEGLKSISSLIELDLSNTTFSDPTLLSTNVSLGIVDLSRTQIDHLFVLPSLPQVTELNVSDTEIVNLNGLEDHLHLEILTINHTPVKTLKQLLNVPNLKKVYADNTGITETLASKFMASKSDVVVVTNSEQVMQWWSSLSKIWKNVLGEKIGKMNPGKEELAKFLNIDSLDLSNKKLYTSHPLKKFRRLKYLDISYNDIDQFDFTRNMKDLECLKGEGLPITSTTGLEDNLKLRRLILTGSKLSDIQSLYSLNELEVLDADRTRLDENEVISFLKSHPGTVVIYQTESLLAWWDALTPAWKKSLKLKEPNSYKLHQLTEQREIFVSGQNITSLSPLAAFVELESINLDGVRIPGLEDLLIHKNLRELKYTNGPLQSLQGITQFNQLESLDISNTAIEDLRNLFGLISLKHLNAAGTGIKNLKGLDKLINLESLNVSNTRIWRLERLYGMSKIKTFICNNTRLSQAKVDAFQEMFPDCNITFY